MRLIQIKNVNSIHHTPFYSLFFYSIVILACIGIYPGTGGEGGQREVLKLSEKSDWHNFMPVFLYSYWPNNILPWKFSLALIQVIIYLLGIKIIYKSLTTVNLKKYLLLTAAVGFFFVIQVVRDATSFSILIFGLSLIVLTSQRSSRRKNKLIITSVFLTIFATLFKPIFAPIVALVFVLFMGKGQNYKSNFIRIGVALVIAVAPLNLDNLLSKNFNLKSTQPEQQLFIYEFSKIYCWGHDTSPNILAKRSLSRFILTNSDFESVCASLEPAGWDHLRSKIPNVANSPSLAPLMDVNSDLVSVLIRDWLKIILSNPFEWLQIKSVDYSQVLFMANSFQIPEIIDDKSNFLPKS